MKWQKRVKQVDLQLFTKCFGSSFPFVHVLTAHFISCKNGAKDRNEIINVANYSSKVSGVRTLDDGSDLEGILRNRNLDLPPPIGLRQPCSVTAF